MNGYKLLEEAAKLLGYPQAEEHLKIIGLPLVNSVISELEYPPLASLSENIGLSGKRLEALKFGLAALVANALGDEESRNAMSQIYSSKLALIKARVTKVRDAMPRGEW